MKKQILLFFLSIGFFTGALAQNVYWQENFDGFTGCGGQGGWTINVVSGAGDWCFDNSANREFGQSISGAPYAIFDDAASPDTDPEIVEMISPTFNTQGRNNSTLSFYQYFEGGGNAIGTVWISTDDGLNWYEIYNIDSTSISNPDKISIPLQNILSAIGGSMQTRIKFEWSADDGFWWIVDDIFYYQNVASDAAAIKADNLPQGCVISLENPIAVTMKNLGNGNISDVYFNLLLNDSILISEYDTFPSPIVNGQTHTYTFDSIPAFEEGLNNLKFWTSQPNGVTDEFPSNDTIYVTSDVFKLQVANLPLIDDFEDTVLASYWCKKIGPSGNGRIRISDTIAACSGNNMVVIDAAINKSTIDALDLLVNLSSCVTKELSFLYGNINDEQDPEDGLYISVDNGGTFNKIMSFDMAGTNGSCREVNINLDNVADTMGITLSETSILRWRHAGNNSIESGTDGFYLDSVAIDLAGLTAIDASVIEILEPDTIIAGDTVKVTVVVTNNSDSTLATGSVYFQYGTQPMVEEFWAGCVGLGEKDTFTFSNALVAAQSGEKLCAGIQEPNNQPDTDGTNDETCIFGVGTKEIIANPFMAVKAYPNPAKAVFNLDIRLAEAADVAFAVRDIVGKKALESNQSLSGGNHQLTLAVTDLPAGVYIYTLKVNDNIVTDKFSIVK